MVMDRTEPKERYVTGNPLVRGDNKRRTLYSEENPKFDPPLAPLPFAEVGVKPTW